MSVLVFHPRNRLRVVGVSSKYRRLEYRGVSSWKTLPESKGAVDETRLQVLQTQF